MNMVVELIPSSISGPTDGPESVHLHRKTSFHMRNRAAPDGRNSESVLPGAGCLVLGVRRSQCKEKKVRSV